MNPTGNQTPVCFYDNPLTKMTNNGHLTRQELEKDVDSQTFTREDLENQLIQINNTTYSNVEDEISERAKLALKFLKVGDLKRSVEVKNSIPVRTAKQELEKEWVRMTNVCCPVEATHASRGKNLVVKFLEINELERAIEIAHTIPTSWSYGPLDGKAQAFNAIVDFIIKRDGKEKALEMADSLNGGYYDDVVLKRVGFAFLDNGFKDEAIYIINKRQYSDILESVALKFNASGFKVEALAFANQIEDKEVKNYVLNKIENS